MQTETRPVTSPLDMGPTGFLSLALSALRLSTPTRIVHPRERIISLEEVSWHDNEKDCWVVIYDRVYDLTNFDMVSLRYFNLFPVVHIRIFIM